MNHRVGFQGEHGAFGEIAARKMVPKNAQLIALPNFAALFEALANRKVDYATAPIENTLYGSIHENYDLLLKYRLTILAETRVRIVHNLIAASGVTLRSIRRVYSQTPALQQCTKFLQRHRRWEVIPYYDTAGSVKMVTEEKRSESAAIASEAAASIYNARILARDIGDNRENYTRFFLLGRAARGKQGRRTSRPADLKTSIAFATSNVSGALFKCLSAFALRDINLTKIESRPLRGRPWEYLFYLDFLGSPALPPCKNALRDLAEITDFVRLLGSYPAVP